MGMNIRYGGGTDDLNTMSDVVLVLAELTHAQARARSAIPFTISCHLPLQFRYGRLLSYESCMVTRNRQQLSPVYMLYRSAYVQCTLLSRHLDNLLTCYCAARATE